MSQKPGRVKNAFSRFLLGLWHIIGTLIILAVLTGVAMVSINIYVIATTDDQVKTVHNLKHREADYILVLGAGLEKDGEPSPILTERLNTGADLSAAEAGRKVLLSGDGESKSHDEVKAMEKYLRTKGLKENKIVIDRKGHSTFESILRAKEEYGAESLVIVSQKFHLSRALDTANALGLEAYGVASDQPPYPSQDEYGTREFWARIKDFTQVRTRNWPDFVKDPIYSLIKRSKEASGWF